jgi:hypothetical protein
VRNLFFLTFALLSSPAFAQDVVADDDDELFGNDSQKKGNNADVPDANAFTNSDDDIDIKVEPKAAPVDKEKDLSAFVDPRASVGSSTRMPLDVVGKDVLGDNWAPQVVIADKDAVVVEMPVMYARSRAEFDGVAYWLVVEALADGKKVAEQRVQVTRDAIADKGPSIQFFRMFTPVPSAAGVIVVNVSKAASAAAKPTLLFTRSVNYKTAG